MRCRRARKATGFPRKLVERKGGAVWYKTSALPFSRKKRWELATTMEKKRSYHDTRVERNASKRFSSCRSGRRAKKGGENLSWGGRKANEKKEKPSCSTREKKRMGEKKREKKRGETVARKNGKKSKNLIKPPIKTRSEKHQKGGGETSTNGEGAIPETKTKKKGAKKTLPRKEKPKRKK